MRPSSALLRGGWLLLLLLPLQGISGITVELSEVQQVGDDRTFGEYDYFNILKKYYPFSGGVSPLDQDCPNSDQCNGVLTRDGSLDLDSRYGCTEPSEPPTDDDGSPESTCCVTLGVATSDWMPSTIASVKVALHPDSTNALTVRVGEGTVVEKWEGTPGSAEFQEILGLDGIETGNIVICGAFGAGDYLAILEVEIYVTVDEVPVVGTSASTRTTITATATADASSAMSTVDGDTNDSSSWTCTSGDVCEITYDLQTPESLEQLRIAFSESSDAGGELRVMTAGESGVFSSVRTGIEAGGRPVGSDGFQTFGGIRAVARYVKIEVVPPSGGSVVINEVEFQVGDSAAIRPVEEKAWLKPTGRLPLADGRSYDGRAAADGGCDSPAQFQGCQAYYIKDEDMDSRWACGPLAAASDCELIFSLNYFRYVRQIQIAFHMGDEEHNEFSIEALTAQGWMTVVASAITFGDTTGYQTFDVSVHAIVLAFLPKFQRFNQWIGINEIIILEKSKNDFVEGTVPVFEVGRRFGVDDDDEGAEVDIPTRFEFDVPSRDDGVVFVLPDSIVTGLRMRFPAGRTFVFEVELDTGAPPETFTSAGGDNVWETFTLSGTPAVGDRVEINAISGPRFFNFPDYPALRVVDFQVLGELEDNGPGFFQIVSTTLLEWRVIPDIIGDGVSEQVEIMTAICETKGATFDGTDCVGELDDSTVHIQLYLGNYYLDGPIFFKSGVTISGRFNVEFTTYTDLVFYEGANTGNTAEEAIVVFDHATGAEMKTINIVQQEGWTGEIVPGTLGNLCLDVRDSEDLYFRDIGPEECRTGAVRFVDSRNITAFIFRKSMHQETGNYMELTRVDDFHVDAFPEMGGLLMDTCNNVLWEGSDPEGYQLPTSTFNPPVGGDQTANVVITGDSSNIVFEECHVGPGAEPRILMESATTLTLDLILEYEEADAGDCIVEVPPGTTDDLIVQINSELNLTKSGDCWVLE